MMLNELGSCHRDHLGAESYVLLELVNGCSVLGVLGEHLEFVALTVGNVVLGLTLEVETATDEQFGFFAVHRQVLG